MKAYIISLAGITLSIISLILFLTLGQIFFIPLVFILPLSGTCFKNRDKEDKEIFNNLAIEPLEYPSKEYYHIYKCPYCGNIIHDEHPKYCSQCGSQLNSQSDKHE